MNARDFIHNIIAQSEPYDRNDQTNIDLFILDSDGNIASIEPTHKLIINDTMFYYTLTANNWIYMYTSPNFEKLFTQLNVDLYGWYGDHFSFGYTNEFPDVLNFHLTKYMFDSVTNQTMRKSIYCDFKVSDFMNDMQNPRCVARQKDTYLPTRFDSIFPPEYAYVKEIIVFGITQQLDEGTIIYNGSPHKLHTGPRGGLYIVLPKDAKGNIKKVSIPKSRLRKSPIITPTTVITTSTVARNASMASATRDAILPTLPILGDSPPKYATATAMATATGIGNTLMPVPQSRNIQTRMPVLGTSPPLHGGGVYAYKFQKSLVHFIKEFAKVTKFKLENNTFIFVKQSTENMIVLFNYTIDDALQSRHQYILHTNMKSINKYMSPGHKYPTQYFHLTRVH